LKLLHKPQRVSFAALPQPSRATDASILQGTGKATMTSAMPAEPFSSSILETSDHGPFFQQLFLANFVKFGNSRQASLLEMP